VKVCVSMRLGFVLEITIPALLLGWATLLVVGAATSQTGYGALAERRAERDVLAAEVAGLAARRREMEHRADLLNSAGLDPDMVDERIRSVLGFARPGDIVVRRDELRTALAALQATRTPSEMRPARARETQPIVSPETGVRISMAEAEPSPWPAE